MLRGRLSTALIFLVAVNLVEICAEEASGSPKPGPRLEIFEPPGIVVYGNSLQIHGRVHPSPDTGFGEARVDTLSWSIPELGKMSYIMFHRSGLFVQSIPISEDEGSLTLKLQLSDKAGRTDERTFLINTRLLDPKIPAPTVSPAPPPDKMPDPAAGPTPPPDKTAPTVDLAPPPAPIRIKSPTDGSFYRSTVRVTGNYGGRPLRIEWQVNALNLQGPANMNLDGTFSFAFSTLGFSMPFVVEVKAVYSNGVDSTSIRLKNAGDGPYLDVQGPIDGGFYLNQLEVAGVIGKDPNGEDALPEVKTLSWWLASIPEKRRSVFFNDEGLFSFNIDLSDETGPLSLEFEAEDKNSNKTRLSFRLSDGRLPPLLRIDFPTEGTQYGGAGIFASGSVTDPYEDVPDYGGLGDLAWVVRPADVRLTDQSINGSAKLERDGSFLIPLHMQDFEGDVELHTTIAGANGEIAEATLLISRGGSDVPSLKVLGLDRSASLSWDLVPDADSLVIDLISGNEKSRIEVAAENRGELVVDSLINGELYEFQLHVISARGNFSSHVVKTIPFSGETLKPLAASEYRQIRLTWPEIPGTREYLVFRSEDDGDFTLLSPPLGEKSFVDSKVLYGIQYFYAIAPAEFPENLSSPTPARTLLVPRQRLEVVASYEGLIPEDIYVQGDYAFVAAGRGGLRIIDISDPIKPVTVGLVESENAAGVAVRGDYAFISDRNKGLLVANIVAPTRPFVVGTKLAGQAAAVGVRDEYAYISDERRGLRIYDVSNVRSPQRVGILEGFNAYDLSIVDDAMLVPAGLKGLAIVSLENPEVPALLGLMETGDVRSIELRDNLACLIDSTGDVLLLDISNPRAPKSLSRIEDARAAYLTIENNYVFVSRFDGELDLYNIDNPGEPTFFGTASLGGLNQLKFKDDYIYASTDKGMVVIQTYLVGNSFVSSGWETQGRSYGLALSSRELVVADHEGGVQIFNSESDVGGPAQVVPSSFAMEVAVANDLLAVADAIDGLSVHYRLPQSNLWGASILEDPIGPAVDVDIYGMSVIAGFEGMNPVFLRISGQGVVNSVELTFPRAKVVSVGELFAAAADNREFRIYEIGSFEELNRQELKGVKDLHIYQNKLYAAGDFGMAIYAFLNSKDMELLSLMPAAHVRSVSVAEGYAFLSCGPEGLLVANVKDPMRPFIISKSSNVFATAAEAIPGAGRVYVADINGVQLVDLVIPSWLR